MKFLIKENSFGLSNEEVIMLISMSLTKDYKALLQGLESKGFICDSSAYTENGIGYSISEYGEKTLNQLLIETEIVLEKEDNDEKNLLSLASKLKEIYPKGKKPGTHYYWSDGVKLIVNRLKVFYKKYGEDFSPEDIISATERYVKSFENNQRYMKLLKYFIFKDEKGAENVEHASDLLTFIENKDEESETSNDWTSSLN